jgi:hypothetical protein
MSFLSKGQTKVANSLIPTLTVHVIVVIPGYPGRPTVPDIGQIKICTDLFFPILIHHKCMSNALLSIKRSF